MDANVDIQKFAEKLVKAGNEGIFWEQKKLEWILEHETEGASRQEATEKSSEAG
jgi:hypothetical protein